jgi:hypothetical protein
MGANWFLRLFAAGAAFWAGTWLAVFGAAKPRKHVAIDPREPAAQPDVGPPVVRSAGPEAMRSDVEHWDEVDQAIDESFPASDPPAR